MKKKKILFVSLLLILTGCGYPQERRQQADCIEEHIQHVEYALKKYQQSHKILPYRYTNNEYKLTTKYLINFKELIGYLSDIPPTAFEKGGNFVYVLTQVEKEPRVKVFDLRVQENVDVVHRAIKRYIHKNKKSPTKERLSSQIYTIDFEKLDIEEKTVPSPYCPIQNRNFLIDEDGRIYVDYRNDVMKLIQQKNFHVKDNQDLRLLLSESSSYVPAYSPILKYINGKLLIFPVNQ